MKRYSGWVLGALSATLLVSAVALTEGKTVIAPKASIQVVKSPVPVSPPVITSPGSAGGIVGAAFNFMITATNSPTSFNATGLPAGLTISHGTGVISGNVNSPGSFPITLSATNVGGTGSKTLTITFNRLPPVITSAASATAVSGAALSYAITATNSSTSFNAVLPPGLTVAHNTGLITGHVNEVGSYKATISAANASGTGTATLTITIIVPPPVILSAASARGSEGAAFTYAIRATNSPTSFNAVGLPAGLGVNKATGVIAGKTGAGRTQITLSAANAAGTGTLSLDLVVLPLPVITSTGTATGIAGKGFLYHITATNSPSSFDADGLPRGISTDHKTGLIIGSTPDAGRYSVTLSATNTAGTASKALNLTITR